MRERRRRAMAVLTCSSVEEIARYLAALDPLPAHTQLREPQSGLVMLRGRIGGDGAPFNFGEATVSRCAVRLATGETGFGYALGRDHEKARLIALVDALLQREQWQPVLERSVLAPIRGPADSGAGEDRAAGCRHQGGIFHAGSRRGLTMIGTGFHQPVFQAQSAFRAILDALARPGTVQALGETVDAPAPLSAGAAAVALTLCDHDTPVWLDGGLRGHDEVAQWLRFHCGCPLVDNPRDAAFAFASDIENLPPFEAFGLGTAEYPDRSTTIVLQVESFERGIELALEGPGIRGRTFVLRRAVAAGHRGTPRREPCAVSARRRSCCSRPQARSPGLPRSVRVVGD